jgi:PAS domain S-box-containing protein
VNHLSHQINSSNSAADTRSTLSADSLLHELDVQQIELKLQNEELRRTQVALEESRDRYLDLYELAPVGYFTLSAAGMVTEINLTGVLLLGEHRENLLIRRFDLCVHPNERERWQRYFIQALQHSEKQSCELILLRSDKSQFHARLDSQSRVANDNVALLHIALSDISELKHAEEARLAELAEELRRWHAATSGREGRILELKTEVNQLLRQQGLPPRYDCADTEETP